MLCGCCLSLWLYLTYPCWGLPVIGENCGVPHTASLPLGAWLCWLLLFHWMATSSNLCISSHGSLSGVLDLSKQLLLGWGWELKLWLEFAFWFACGASGVELLITKTCSRSAYTAMSLCSISWKQSLKPYFVCISTSKLLTFELDAVIKGRTVSGL